MTKQGALQKVRAHTLLAAKKLAEVTQIDRVGDQGLELLQQLFRSTPEKEV
jgi:hypothetical protein